MISVRQRNRELAIREQIRMCEHFLNQIQFCQNESVIEMLLDKSLAALVPKASYSKGDKEGHANHKENSSSPHSLAS